MPSTTSRRTPEGDKIQTYLTVGDVARISQQSEHTVRMAIARGGLDAVRFGRNIRITRAAFDRWQRPV